MFPVEISGGGGANRAVWEVSTSVIVDMFSLEFVAADGFRGMGPKIGSIN